jgi:hypothetical protein
LVGEHSSPREEVEYRCPECGGWQAESWTLVGCTGR